MKKISIIIPVYNVEMYINQCIESIITQNIDDVEILLIDDGSTDNSGKICDEYEKMYDFIKTIHQSNKGLSGARNTGIRNASGEYLMFVDSDDYVNKDVDLNSIVQNLNGSIIQYKWVYFFDNTGKYMFFKDKNTYSDEKEYWTILSKKVADNSISTSACDKFVKRNIIVDNNIYFKEGIVCEDIDWSLRLYMCAHDISTINENIYVYRQQRKGSITNNQKSSSKNVICMYDIINYWYKYDYEEKVVKNIYLNYLSYYYVILLCLINKNNCSKELKTKIYDLKPILNYSNNKKVRICKTFMKLLGDYFSIQIFKTYIRMKNIGIIKI